MPTTLQHDDPCSRLEGLAHRAPEHAEFFWRTALTAAWINDLDAKRSDLTLDLDDSVT